MGCARRHRVARGGKTGSREETTSGGRGHLRAAPPSTLAGTDWGCQERGSGAKVARRGVGFFFFYIYFNLFFKMFISLFLRGEGS